MRMLAFKEVGCKIARWLKMGTNHSSKGCGQYRLEVSLDCYKWYQSQSLGSMSARRLAPQVDPNHREERNISYKNVETSSYQIDFKIVRLTTICYKQKRTIYISGRLELLQYSY